MIGVREAVQKVIGYAVDILGPERATGVLLEEVRSDTVSQKDAWLITISVPKPRSALSPAASLNAVFGSGEDRDYKTVAVSKETGEFIEMTIRSLAAQQ